MRKFGEIHLGATQIEIGRNFAERNEYTRLRITLFQFISRSPVAWSPCAVNKPIFPASINRDIINLALVIIFSGLFPYMYEDLQVSSARSK